MKPLALLFGSALAALSPLNNLEGADAVSTPSIYFKKPLTKKQKNNRKKAKAAKVARRKNRK